MMALFRGEAIAAMQKTEFGAPVASRPMAWTVMLCLFLIFGAATITVLSLVKFARKETAYGALNFSKGELRVLPARGGVVRELYVSEGQAVRQGDPLALISTEQQLIGGAAVDAHVMEAIDGEQETLETRLAALDASAPLEAKAKIEHIRGLNGQIDQLKQTLPIRLERQRLSKQAADEGRTAATRGYLSGDNLRQRVYDSLAAQQAVSDLQTQIAQLESQASEEQTSLEMLPSKTAQERASVQREIVSLNERRANTQAQNSYLLSAPEAGTVSSLQALVGQPADPGKPLMAIVPIGSTLQAEIYVPSRAIGFVQPGQTVRILYDAFPHERFGIASGQITDIAGTILKPDEITTVAPQKEPAYRVLVKLDHDDVTAYGRKFPLRSGMALTADILLDRRSFLGLLMDPLLASGHRIFTN
ncbi:HlyD family secretion protein [Labrys okinawensis]|uniref:HlyD family secretion protein n=1 Tax=Labrys okinawensis TaxID=346911 RepID=UPI0039BD640C